MAGVNVGGANGKKRALDSEINMIPMIDLLMVTVSFLLITAVWVQSQRLEANAQVPGPITDVPPCGDCKEEARLHVETSDPSKYVLAWKTGRTVVRTVDIPRETRKASGSIALPNLAAKVADEWKTGGMHREASDRKFDHAVVHAANDMAYSDLVAVMDAVAQPKRQYANAGKVFETGAFEVTFATD
jgi:biopolymer transport protein ExbD